MRPIHVDAAHEYEEVMRDLNLYWDLLDDGGCLIGDDYHWTWPGVPLAFRQFAREKGLPLRMSLSKCFLGKGTDFIPTGSIAVSNDPDLFFDFEVNDYRHRHREGS